MAIAGAFGEGLTDSPFQWPDLSVYVKQLWADEWEWIPYLYPTNVKLVAQSGGAVSTAQLKYEFGNAKREDVNAIESFDFLVLNGLYVLVTSFEGYEEADLFQGIIDIEDGDDFGSPTPAGRQTFTAYGYGHLLDRDEIRGSFTDDGFIDRAVTFNQHGGRGLVLQGNRSTDALEDGAHVFSVDGALWSNLDIINYILTSHNNTGIEIRVTGQTELIESIFEVHNLHGLSVRQAISKLIDRRRGAGWLILREPPDEAQGSGEAGEVETLAIKIFSVLSEALSVGDDLLPANADQMTLEVEEDILANPVLNFSSAEEYDDLLVEGGSVMMCGTFSIAEATIQKGWTSGEESSYKVGDRTGNSTAEEDDAARKADRFAPVFSKLEVPADWDWLIGNGEGGSGVTQTNFAPGVTDGGYIDASLTPAQWRPDQRFERTLPILEAIATDTGSGGGSGIGSGSGAAALLSQADAEFRKPFALVKDGETYYLSERAEKDGSASPVSFRVSDRELAVYLAAPANHVMALNHWAESLNSNTEPAYDYEDVMITVFVRTDTNLRRKISLGTDPSQRDGTKTKRIAVPDAEMWLIAPGTVVDTEDGKLVRVEDTDLSLIVRDDSARLRSIAGLALAWYGTQRNTVDLPFIGHHTDVPLGSMIRGLGGRWHDMAVNTVVTQVEFQLDKREGIPETHIMTGYDELAFASLGA